MTATTPSKRRVIRRFAPLDPSIPNKHSAPKLQGIVFDVDGTLCLPQNHMFTQMRTALSIPPSTDILTHIASLSSDPPRQAAAISAIKRIERDAMTEQTPQPGLQELMSYLDSRQIRRGVCTRNFLTPVQHLFDMCLGGGNGGFAPVVTRETEGVRAKPSPEGVWACGRAWGLDRGEEGLVGLEDEQGEDVLERTRRVLGRGVIMVGDSVDDLVAGRRAGAATVLLVNEENGHLVEREECDVVVRRLDELVGVLEGGFEGRP